MTEYDMEDAIQVAEEFLKGRHNTMNLESSSLKDNVWCLVFDVGFLTQQLKELQVDANSGKVIGYVNLDTDEDDDDDDDE